MDPEKRASAKTMLDHPWLAMESNYDTKLSEVEIEIKTQKAADKEARKKLKGKDDDSDFLDEELKIETSKLVASDTE